MTTIPGPGGGEGDFGEGGLESPSALEEGGLPATTFSTTYMMLARNLRVINTRGLLTVTETVTGVDGSSATTTSACNEQQWSVPALEALSRVALEDEAEG